MVIQRHIVAAKQTIALLVAASACGVALAYPVLFSTGAAKQQEQGSTSVALITQLDQEAKQTTASYWNPSADSQQAQVPQQKHLQ